MPNNWKTYKLEKVATLQRGFDLPNTKRNDGKYPVIAASGFSTWHNEFKVKAPGVTTGRSGTLGQVHYVKDDFWPLNTSLWVKDFNGNDERFIYYFLQTLNFEEYNSGTSVPTLNRNDVHKLDVTIPDITEQKSIASILSAIDDKIENNLAINKTLEEMAMALYKHWFVDFGPFKDGEFVESELGLIPKDWEVKKIGDVNFDIGDGNYSSKYPTNKEFIEYGIPFIRAVNMKNGTLIRKDILFISPEKHTQITKGHLKKGDVLLVTRGMIGEIARVPNYFIDSNINAQLVRINGNNIIPSSYLFLMLKEDKINNTIKANTSGTALQQLPISALKSISIVIPTILIMNDFDSKISILFETIDENNNEIEFLTKLRNSLLPKLITGELRLKEFREN